jgi:hypothetical protein
MRLKLGTLLVCLLAAWPVTAQTRFEFWPGAKYDPRVPTFKKVLGYEPGERISSPAQLHEYLDALATASPRQMKVFEYGRSWEGRKLVYAAIGSEANLQRLGAIRNAMQKLADPRTCSEAEAHKLMAGLPAVIWLAYGVHGNEISSPEAALVTAYHLLAARNDDIVDSIRNNVLVLIAPLQNPDGRERFVHHFEQAEGLEPDASPAAAEHIENWPGGRGNHYLFDMNRDWFALTQPEIRAQAKTLLEWYPLVCADLHEMGADSTYYFAPGADPFNPHLTPAQRDLIGVFGKNNARWFDRFGFDYFTRDVYDAFYPGYGDSWPALFGSVAMTYEQASTRGLVVRRRDDTLLAYRDAVRQHFVACISTGEAAAKNREKLLEHFYSYRRSAIEEGGREPVREYILPRAGDTSAVDKLAAVLAEQGVELKRATAPFRAAGREFPAGSYVVSLAQPAKRLIRTLLDPQVPMDAAFVKEQDRLRRKKLPDEIYDVTSWSLPLAFNVEAVAAAEPSAGAFELVRPERIPPGRLEAAPNALAYLAPWGSQAAGRLLTGALRADLRVLSSDRAFSQNGRKYPAGTLVFEKRRNSEGLAQKLEALAKASGAEIFGTASGWVEDGPNFGSRFMVELRKPAIALAWDRPASSVSAGQARFVLERQYGYPVTAVRTQTLGAADLSRFDVLILPEAWGSYAEALGAGGVRKLKEWVAAGGTLVALDSAVAFLADPKVALLAVSQEDAPRVADAAKKPEAAKPEANEPRVPGKLLTTEAEYQTAIQADKELPDRALGAMLRARLDPDQWVTAGLTGAVNAMVNGREVYTPIKLDKGINAAVFLGPDQLVASGQMWEESRKQFAYKPLIVVQPEGRGQVIAFTADPNFRAYLDGMNVLFLNAVFRGPGHVRAGGAEAER